MKSCRSCESNNWIHSFATTWRVDSEVPCERDDDRLSNETTSSSSFLPSLPSSLPLSPLILHRSDRIESNTFAERENETHNCAHFFPRERERERDTPLPSLPFPPLPPLLCLLFSCMPHAFSSAHTLPPSFLCYPSSPYFPFPHVRLTSSISLPFSFYSRWLPCLFVVPSVIVFPCQLLSFSSHIFTTSTIDRWLWRTATFAIDTPLRSVVTQCGRVVRGRVHRPKTNFQIWLTRVEESRQDSSSYIANEDREEQDSSSNPVSSRLIDCFFSSLPFIHSLISSLTWPPLAHSFSSLLSSNNGPDLSLEGGLSLSSLDCLRFRWHWSSCFCGSPSRLLLCTKDRHDYQLLVFRHCLTRDGWLVVS